MESDAHALPSHNGNGNGTYYPVQLTSPSEELAETQDMQPGDMDPRQWLAIARRRALVLIGVAVAVTGIVGIRTFTLTPEYEGEFQLLVESVTADDNLTDLQQTLGSGASSGGVDYETQIEVLLSPQLLSPILDRLRAEYPKLTYEQLIRNLSIRRLQETKILEIRYRHSRPDQIQFVLERLAEGYLNYSLEERQTSLRQGIRFVEDQLPQMEVRVNSLQQQLEKLRQQYNFINPETRSRDLSGQLNNVVNQRLTLQQNLIEAQRRYAGLLQQPGAEAALREDQYYQARLNEFRDLENQIALEQARSLDNNLAIQSLRRKQENLLPLLRDEAEQSLNSRVAKAVNEVQILEARQSAILQAEQLLEQQLSQLPTLSRLSTELERELEIATESLTRLLAARETLLLESAQKEIPWQLLAMPETPTSPVSPNVMRNLIYGAIAGFVLGVAAALLAERLDYVFHTSEDLKTSTKLPLLGEIPYNKALKHVSKLQVSDAILGLNQPEEETEQAAVLEALMQPNQAYATPFLEAFRSLAINIRLLGSDSPIRSFLIGSATASDGKSTVSMHLAYAIATMGQRVLLVDADLRRPRVHTILGIANLRGLSNLLTSSLLPDDCIQSSTVDENLHILTAGQTPPDPSRLLSSQKMQTLMEQLRSRYDLVIYDTPPFLGLSDASVLVSQTNGLVMVVGLGKTNRAAVRQALDGLRTARASILGVVANGIKRATLSNLGYYYNAYYKQGAAPLTESEPAVFNSADTDNS